jgi:uncharacterized protein (TIGR03435 family)
MNKPTLLLILAAAGLATAAEPQFEVATVKFNDHSDPRMGSGPSSRNGKFNAGNLTLKKLISFAYDVPEFQMKGPAWLESEHFDVTAKMPDGSPDSQVKPMLRKLLEDRFHLQTHLETAEMSYYALVVGKSGSKIKELRDGEPIPPPTFLPGGAAMMTNGTVESFAGQLAPAVGRPVLDKTGMTGRFHIFVNYAPARAGAAGDVSDPGPDLFTAIQDQLGLKLEPQKGPVEILAVDSAAKLPDGN